MHESFTRLLGIEPPVRGGDISLIDKDTFHLASQKLMEKAGHIRVNIGASYFGSRRRRRSKQKTAKIIFMPVNEIKEGSKSY
jgi:hypothetical protein